MTTKDIQSRLKVHGFYNGPISGKLDSATSAAIIRFKTFKGLAARDYVGPITIGELLKAPSITNAPPAVLDEPIWLRRARQEIGVSEIAGKQHSKRVLSYWELAKLNFSDDETPWCAGFVGAMLEDCGIRSTRSGMARSYSGSTYFKKLDKFVKGCVVVFWRGSKSSGSGHVGFGVGKDQDGNVMVLGGNQSDAVNIKPFSTSRLVGYYWPVAVPVIGETSVPLINSDGQVSTNEA